MAGQKTEALSKNGFHLVGKRVTMCAVAKLPLNGRLDAAINNTSGFQEDRSMVPNIDYSLCEGCGGCADAFPKFFEMRGGRAWVINAETFDPGLRDAVLHICPYYAISVE